jgi:curved DNA-binding protein CbpA
MKEINEAYLVLSNSQKRRQYDALRHQYGSSGYERFRQSYTEEDIFKGSDINSIFDEMAKVFGFRSADEIFPDMYGLKYRRFEFGAPGVFGRGFIFFGPYVGGSGAWQREGELYGSRKPPIFSGQAPFLSGIFDRIIKYVLTKLTGIETPERGNDLYLRVKIQDSLYGKLKNFLNTVGFQGR